MKLQLALIILPSSFSTTFGELWDITGPCLQDLEYPDCVTTEDYPNSWHLPYWGASCTFKLTDPGSRLLEFPVLERAPWNLHVDGYNTWRSYSYFEDYQKKERTAKQAPTQGIVVNSSTNFSWSSKYWDERGWRFCALAMQGPWVITGDCDVDPSDTDCVTSGYHPDNYDIDDRCYIRMFSEQPRILEVTTFSTSYDDDFVVNASGSILNFSGEDSAVLDGLPVDNSTTITWKVNSQETSAGWRVCARGDRVWSISGDCNLADDDSRCIVSPHFDESFLGNESCSMHTVGNVTRQLQLTWFDMESEEDMFSVQNGEDTVWTNYTGGQFPVELDWLIVDETTRLQWTSGPDSPGGNWRLCAGDIRTTTTTTTATWSSTGVWSLTGPCEIDPDDAECIRNPEFGTSSVVQWTSHYDCDMHILEGERILNVSLFSMHRDGSLTIGNRNVSFQSYDPGRLHGTIINASTNLHWDRSIIFWGGQDWRICARALGTWNQTLTINRAWNVSGACRIDPHDEECILHPEFIDGRVPLLTHCDMRPMGSTRRILMVKNYELNARNKRLEIKRGPRAQGLDLTTFNRILVDNASLITWHTTGEPYPSRPRFGDSWELCAREVDDWSSRLWAVTGDCAVDPDDHDCITTSNFPRYYHRGDECIIRFTGNQTRQLQVTTFSTGKPDDDYLKIINETSATKMYLKRRGIQGLEVDQNTTIIWDPDAGRGPRSGWRICARTLDSFIDLDLYYPPTTTTTTSRPRWQIAEEKERQEKRAKSRNVLIIYVSASVGFFLVLFSVLAARRYGIRRCKRKPRDPTTAASSASDGRAQTVASFQCRSCRASFTVSQSAAALKVTCPSCLAVNEFAIASDVAATLPPEADLPDYWTSDRAAGMFSGLVTESDDIKETMQILLDRTWKNVVTRDRPHADKLSKFEVLIVHRNENILKWDRYARTRAEVASQCHGCEVQTAKTTSEILDDPMCVAFLESAKLDESSNEFYLFHGTKPSAAKAICDTSFELSLAGTNAGTLYGPGLYFSEASSKSDEYAEQDSEGIFGGLYAVLLCRVVCGDMMYTDEARPNREDLVNSIVKYRTKHSILGDREKCKKTYREFIVFDRDQVYPEYAIIYRRVPRQSQE